VSGPPCGILAPLAPPSLAVSWLAPLAGALWAAWHLRHAYFFYDEWGMVGRVLHAGMWEGMFASFNGHLWALQYWIYRIQVHQFGVDDHRFVGVVFVAALVVLHLGLATLLRVSGLSAISSTLLAGLLTYLGASSQNFVFAVQASPALSLAAGTAATAIVLAGRPTRRRAAGVAGLLVLSVAIDSGTALATIPMSGVATMLAWRGPARLAVLPALVIVVLWFGFVPAPVFHAGWDTRAHFAVRLLLHATGALAAGGSGTGLVLWLLAAILVAMAFRGGHLDARSRIMIAAGGAATCVVLAAIAYARAGIEGDFVTHNRYLQNVAIPLTLALAPACAIAGRGVVRAAWPSPPAGAATGLAALVFAGAFLLGLTPKDIYLREFVSYNVGVRDGVTSAARVIRDGCPSGQPPVAASQPLGSISPQLTTGLVRELLDRGFLSPPAAGPIDPAVAARMCS